MNSTCFHIVHPEHMQSRFRSLSGHLEPKFSAGAVFCSLHIPLLQFSPEWPCGNRAVLRGLFLLYFASVHFWSVLLSPRQYSVVNACSFTCNRELWGLIDLEQVMKLFEALFLCSVIHVLREEDPESLLLILCELQDRLFVAWKWRACSLGCRICQKFEQV